MSIVSAIVDKGKKHYLPDYRVISGKNSMLVPDIINVRTAQSRLGRLRGAGNVYFDSKDGRWIVFKHVKDPAQIAQSALSLSKTSTGWNTSLFSNYCGARVPTGSINCPTCGIDQ